MNPITSETEQEQAKKPEWTELLEASLLVAISFASLLTWLAIVTTKGDMALVQGMFSFLSVTAGA